MILTHTILLWACYPYHVGKTKKNRVRHRVRHSFMLMMMRVRHSFLVRRVRQPNDIKFWTWYLIILTYNILLWACYQYHVEKTAKNRVRHRVRHKGSSFGRFGTIFLPLIGHDITWYLHHQYFFDNVFNIMQKKQGSAWVRHGFGTGSALVQPKKFKMCRTPQWYWNSAMISYDMFIYHTSLGILSIWC